MQTASIILAVLIAYMYGAIWVNGLVVGMIERGTAAMARDGASPVDVEFARAAGYDRITVSTLLWPWTLIELAILLVETIREN